MDTPRMPNINQVALSGRIVETPVLRTSEKEGNRLSARIAVSRSYRDDQGNWQEDVSFFNVVIRDKSAEYFGEQLSKGVPVFLTGRLSSRPCSEANEVEIHVRTLQILEQTQVKE